MAHLPALLERIVMDPAIQHGKPCLRGTRTPVSGILEALSTGLTPAAVCQEYPPLTERDVLACMSYAALLADDEEVIPLAHDRS